MFLWNVYTYTRHRMRGKYWKALGAVLLYVIPALVFQLVPKLLAAVLLHLDYLTPQQLFRADCLHWRLLTGIWAFLGFAVLFPLQCGVYSWLTALLGLEERGRKPVFFPNARAYWSGFGFFAVLRILKILAILPLLLSLWAGSIALQNSAASEDGGLWLFLAVQCLVAAVWLAIGYLRVCLAAAAAPFWFLAGTYRDPFRAMHASYAMLGGMEWRLLLLGLPYLPAMLTIVGIPFLLPHLMTNYVLLLQIRMREWVQLKEKHHAHTAILRGARRTLPPRGVPSS